MTMASTVLIDPRMPAMFSSIHHRQTEIDYVPRTILKAAFQPSDTIFPIPEREGSACLLRRILPTS